MYLFIDPKGNHIAFHYYDFVYFSVMIDKLMCHLTRIFLSFNHVVTLEDPLCARHDSKGW